MSGTDRDLYLAGLAPGTDIDHRGTTFTDTLLTALQSALYDPATGIIRFGHTQFDHATFKSDASFAAVTFEGIAQFSSTTFEGEARFDHATFEGSANFLASTFKHDAQFGHATFKSDAVFVVATFGPEGDAASFTGSTFGSDARFESSTFGGDARFVRATFGGDARFTDVTFKRYGWFKAATFKGDTEFQLATFEGDARFGGATFERSGFFGPLVCAGQIVLSGASFGGPVILEFAARRLECYRARWAATAEIRLRYTTVDFAHAVFEYPLTIAAEPGPFLDSAGERLTEDAFAGTTDPNVRLTSLRGVDAAHLVLADINLSHCLFTGAVHLDQLRLEGACTFDATPSPAGWVRWPPVRFTRRRTLAEEHHWRANRPGAVRGWNVAVLGTGRAGPLQLAPVYRALRKAFEDGKHEPGAADFYYGEMEMRRHADDIPRAERWLLTAYWGLSGYGLRASRALAWLGAAMILTIGLLMAWGISQDTPKQTATGTVPPGGGRVTFEIDKDDPKNPTGDRFTGERFEKAVNVTLNSVVFRSSGQDLTTTGTYIEMTSRLTEPVLLGLAVLAIRNRVKR